MPSSNHPRGVAHPSPRTRIRVESGDHPIATAPREPRRSMHDRYQLPRANALADPGPPPPPPAAADGIRPVLLVGAGPRHRSRRRLARRRVRGYRGTPADRPDHRARNRRRRRPLRPADARHLRDRVGAAARRRRPHPSARGSAPAVRSGAGRHRHPVPRRSASRRALSSPRSCRSATSCRRSTSGARSASWAHCSPSVAVIGLVVIIARTSRASAPRSAPCRIREGFRGSAAPGTAAEAPDSGDGASADLLPAARRGRRLRPSRPVPGARRRATRRSRSGARPTTRGGCRATRGVASSRMPNAPRASGPARSAPRQGPPSRPKRPSAAASAGRRSPARASATSCSSSALPS